MKMKRQNEMICEGFVVWRIIELNGGMMSRMGSGVEGEMVTNEELGSWVEVWGKLANVCECLRQ
jgi:hypothetical protein